MSILKSLKTIYTKEGKDREPPKEGFKRFGYILINHYNKFIMLNLIYILFCLPVVTMPAATIALNRVLYNLYYHGNCFFWQDFIAEFKSVFKKSLIYCLLCAGFVFMAVWCKTLTDSVFLTGQMINLSIIASFVICVYLWIFLCFALSMHSIIQLPLKAVLKNSAILAFIEIKTNLLLLFLPGLCLFISYLFVPYSLPVIIVLLFSVVQFLICVITIKSIEAKVIVKK